uniref:Sepiapterin reductase a n=1 Tax=Amphiprion percula TaxID=161767 RepID=A0A3P8SAI2_AMPPE
MKTRGLICIITGASNGFGRALVHRVRDGLPGSVLLLVAHSGTLLQELKEDLQSFTEEQHLQICCIIADLSTKDGVEEMVTRARQEAVSKLDHVLLINNAGDFLLNKFGCPLQKGQN